MNTATEATTPSTEPPAGKLAKLWAALVIFLTKTVKMYLVVIGAAIIAVLIWAVSSNLKDVDRRQRDADAREAARVAYTTALRTYDVEVRARADCVAAVVRSDDNRGQHLANVKAWESFREILHVAFPGSELVDVAIDNVVADLEAGPLLSSPPRTVEDCPPEPAQPEPPAALIGAP